MMNPLAASTLDVNWNNTQFHLALVELQHVFMSRHKDYTLCDAPSVVIPETAILLKAMPTQIDLADIAGSIYP